MSQSRDIFVKKMKAKLDEWNAEIDKLEAQREHRVPEARQRARFVAEQELVKQLGIVGRLPVAVGTDDEHGLPFAPQMM